MSDDTFDPSFLDGEQPTPKLPPLRTFKVTRTGWPELTIEAHAMDRDGNTVAFVVVEIVEGTPIPRIRHLVTSLDMEVQEMVEFNNMSRLLS